MIKKLCILLLTAFMAAPLLAQPRSSVAVDDYSTRAGQWQVSMVVGNSGFLNEDLNSYLVPSVSNHGGSVGLPNGGTDASGDLSSYLNISGFNTSYNIVGLQGKYFLTDHWEINASFGLNIDLTPSKDYIEGDNSVPDMVIPEYQYINAQTTHNWYVKVGSNRYFKLRSPRVHPYVGAAVTYQMARLATSEPYIGEDANGDDLHLYQSGLNIGLTQGFKTALVAGIEYSLTPELVVGFEFNPASYRYDVIQMSPRGYGVYAAAHHSVRVFDMPSLKLGIRF